MRFQVPANNDLACQGSRFFATPAGQVMETAELAMARQQTEGCTGDRALLLGGGCDERILDALHVRRRYVARICHANLPRRLPVNNAPALVATPDNLPFPNGLFDVLILFHAHDLAADPRQSLREAVRVLADGGWLLVIGFNPWSLWGARHWCATPWTPWQAHCVSLARMTDWLSLLGMRVCARRHLPLPISRSVFRNTALQPTGRMLLAQSLCGWVIKAHKDVLQGVGHVPQFMHDRSGRLVPNSLSAARTSGVVSE